MVAGSKAKYLHRLLEGGVPTSAPCTSDDFDLALALTHDREEWILMSEPPIKVAVDCSTGAAPPLVRTGNK